MNPTKHQRRRSFFNQAHLRISFVFYITVFLFQACAPKTDQNYRPAWVIGTVTDSLSSTPIDSAITNQGDTLTSTDSIFTDTVGSYFFFAGAQDLNRPIFCRKVGYQPQKKIVDLVKDTTRVDFKMVP